MSRTVRVLSGLVLVTLLTTTLVACGGEDPDAPPAGGRLDASEPIEISIDGDRVAPNGARVRVERGQQIQFVVTSDRAGELHVHSVPEQTLTFPEGTTELDLVVEQPGVVDMEIHDPDLIVLQLEVR